ncbi:MAG: hypothetical protein EPN84_02440 [Legionella sp.]|nr:MAG: hypothetical protein EPN84_02440 [Legionella sp.]
MKLKIDLKTTQFFLGIGKTQWHSFVFLGIYEGNKVVSLLARAGKGLDKNVNPNGFCANSWGFFFSEVPGSILINENLHYNQKGHLPVSYHAYDISYKQYLDYLRMMERLETKGKQFECYKPISYQANQVELELTKNPMFNGFADSEKEKKNQDNVRASFARLSLGNTCRHSAINLVETVQDHSISPQVSSFFYFDLPCKTFLDFGCPTADVPFYVLPKPPMPYEHSAAHYALAKKLYQRLEQLVLLDPHSPATQAKFNVLKELYLQKFNVATDLDLKELYAQIVSWKEQNKDNLNYLRKTYFWDYFFSRQSASMSLIEEMENDIKHHLAP